jgi:hypothetical protein
MSFDDNLLRALRTEQLNYAVEALSVPGAEKNSYEYGLRVGIFNGYQRAIDLITKLLTEEKFSER